MKQKLYLLSICICLLAVNLIGQEYKTGIGFRSGFSNGLSVKHFIETENAVEVIVATRWRGINVTGLYEMHQPAFNVDQLYWYYGGGAHIGFWNGEYVDWKDDNKSHTVIGVDGIIGLEYNLSSIPINFSLDWKPSMNFSGYGGFWGDGFALSARYLIQ